MKNKVLVTFLMIFCFIPALIGCEKGVPYSGEDYDLFSVALNSLLGVSGYSGKGATPKIIIIEEDSYGRKLFSYQSDGFVAAYSVLICQKSDDNYAYYYPDYNFISAEYKSNVNVESLFTTEEINELKQLNDWNKEIDEEKCVKVKIIKEKKNTKITKETEKKFRYLMREIATDTGYKGDDTLFRNAILCTTDDYGRKLYYVNGVGYDAYGEGVSPNSVSRDFHLVVIFNPDGTFDEIKCVIELTDYYKYQTQVKNFKGLNNWNHPL